MEVGGKGGSTSSRSAESKYAPTRMRTLVKSSIVPTIAIDIEGDEVEMR